MQPLTAYVTELCQYLNDYVLSDGDAAISALDMLDALASCGLVLEEDEEARSSRAYLGLIKTQTRS